MNLKCLVGFHGERWLAFDFCEGGHTTIHEVCPNCNHATKHTEMMGDQ